MGGPPHALEARNARTRSRITAPMSTRSTSGTEKLHGVHVDAASHAARQSGARPLDREENLAKRCPIRASNHDAKPVSPAEARERRGGRSEDVYARAPVRPRRARPARAPRTRRARPLPSPRRRARAPRARTAGSRARGGRRARAPGTRDVVLGGERDGGVLRIVRLHEHAPGASPRPARPATCTRSWKARSAARKSGMQSAASALTTPTSVTCGRSCPLVTICVPTRMSISRARIEQYPLDRRDRAPRAPRHFASRRRRRGRAAPRAPSGTRPPASPRASRCRAPRATSAVPAPGTWRSARRDGRLEVAVVAAEHEPARLWKVSATEQCGQAHISPHASQRTLGAKPRRLRKRIACSPCGERLLERAVERERDPLVAGRARADAPQVDDLDARHRLHRARSGKTSFAALPVRASCSLSSDGVALPSTHTPPARCARRIAMSRAW